MNQPWIYMYSPSRFPLPPPSPSLSTGFSQHTSPKHLSQASNLGRWSVSHLIIYMFQCYSRRLSYPNLLPGIQFPIQELNQGLLHCRQILYQLSYQGSLIFKIFIYLWIFLICLLLIFNLVSSLISFSFSWPVHMVHKIPVSWPGRNMCPQKWNVDRVLTTGPPGNSLFINFWLSMT